MSPGIHLISQNISKKKPIAFLIVLILAALFSNQPQNKSISKATPIKTESSSTARVGATLCVEALKQFIDRAEQFQKTQKHIK